MLRIQPTKSVPRLSGLIAAMFVAAGILASPAPAWAANSGPELSASQQVTATTVPAPTLPAEDRRLLRGDQVVSGEDFTLRSGDTLRGDLTVVGGNVSLEEGSRVEGDVSVFGGNADIYGTVTGNFTMAGGSVHLHSSSRIEGKETVFGGTVRRDEGAYVGGEGTRWNGPIFGRTFPFNNRSPFSFMFNMLGDVFTALAGVVLITLFAVAAVALFPANVARVAETVQRQPLISGTVGILTFVAVPIVIALLAITICLIPAAVVVAIGWALGILFGWSVIARVVGERLMIGFNQRSWTLIGQTVLGAVVLGLLGALPFVGWLIGLLASSVGLGALILTRGGSHPYPLAPIQTPPPPESPQLPTAA